MHFPCDENIIGQLNACAPALAATLDSRGLLLRSDDNTDSFAVRLRALRKTYADFERRLAGERRIELFENVIIDTNTRIPAETLDEAASITRQLYAFEVDWVPGFFLSGNIGPLWGGCAITDPDEPLVIFLIRKNFARARRWFIYRRDELLAHELCHAVRMPLGDFPYEEHFAYRTAASRFRRYIGNCFRNKYDAVIFLLPTLLLPAAEALRTFAGYNYPIWPFWLGAVLYPLWLLSRNQIQRNTFFRARKTLVATGCLQPDAVLFRCAGDEIADIARLRRDPAKLLKELRKKAAGNLKWQVAMYRFWDNGPLLDLKEFILSTQEKEVPNVDSTE